MLFLWIYVDFKAISLIISTKKKLPTCREEDANLKSLLPTGLIVKMCRTSFFYRIIYIKFIWDNITWHLVSNRRSVFDDDAEKGGNLFVAIFLQEKRDVLIRVIQKFVLLTLLNEVDWITPCLIFDRNNSRNVAYKQPFYLRSKTKVNIWKIISFYIFLVNSYLRYLTKELRTNSF